MAVELFDWAVERAAAQAAARTAMAHAERGAPAGWMDEARDTVEAVASVLGEFTSEDVWAAGLAQPSEPRALGAVLHALAAEGCIRATGEWRKGGRVESHGRPVRVWRWVNGN